jgi:hypothetical protein
MPGFSDACPSAKTITDCDRRRLAASLGLPDAKADGANRHEVMRTRCGLDPGKDPECAQSCSHRSSCRHPPE